MNYTHPRFVSCCRIAASVIRPQIGAFAALALLAVACNKNKLTGEFGVFRGSYTWTSTGMATGSGINITSATLERSHVPYAIAFELNDHGEALFYKNGALISKNKYTIQDKESNAFGGKELRIKLKGNLNGMSIDESKLHLRLSGDTALSVDKFPFPAVDDVSNYKSGYRSLSNAYHKQ